MWEEIIFFFEEIKNFFVSTWDDFLGSFAAIVEGIPVPAFMTNLGTFTIPDSILFYASGLQIPAGVAIIVSAYTVRFFIRRLPVVG